MWLANIPTIGIFIVSFMDMFRDNSAMIIILAALVIAMIANFWGTIKKILISVIVVLIVLGAVFLSNLN